jgi:hypothetical protein
MNHTTPDSNLVNDTTEEGKSAIKDQSIDVRFERWVARNPEIVRLFLNFARQAHEAGYTRYSISALTQRVRWEVSIPTRDEEVFKISNNYLSRLARLLMQMDPTLAGFFELRELRIVANASSELGEPTDNKTPVTDSKA